MAGEKQALEPASDSSAYNDRASPDCIEAFFQKSGTNFTNPSGRGRVRDIKKVAVQACCRIFAYLLFPVHLTLNRIQICSGYKVSFHTRSVGLDNCKCHSVFFFSWRANGYQCEVCIMTLKKLLNGVLVFWFYIGNNLFWLNQSFWVRGGIHYITLKLWLACNSLCRPGQS